MKKVELWDSVDYHTVEQVLGLVYDKNQDDIQYYTTTLQKTLTKEEEKQILIALKSCEEFNDRISKILDG